MFNKKSPNTRGHKSLSVMLVAFIAYFLVIATWSFATPLMASPDEPEHIAKAASVVRGQLTGNLIGGPLSPKGIVKIPYVYSNLDTLTSCPQAHPTVPVSCTPKNHTAKTSVSELIYVARYEPLYYAIVGLPTLFTQSTLGIYLIRLTSALISALFLALAVTAIVKWSRSWLLLAGVIAASTPSVLYFAGVVNPAGFEASVAICFWTSILILVCEKPQSPPKGLVALVALSAGIESLVQSLSPVWVVLTLLVAIFMTNRKTVLGLLSQLSVKIGVAFAAACGVIATILILVLHTTDVVSQGLIVSNSTSNHRLMDLVLRRTPLYFEEVTSFFGALNIPSPRLVYIGWAVMLSLACLLALYYGTRWQRIVLTFLVFAVILIPALISASQARRVGIVWQGSDELAIFVGIPILASSIIANSSPRSINLMQRLSIPVVTIVAGLLTVIAFFAELRRYTVGMHGPDFSIFHSAWSPPLGVTDLLIVEIFATILYISLFVWLGKSLSGHNKEQKIIS